MGPRQSAPSQTVTIPGKPGGNGSVNAGLLPIDPVNVSSQIKLYSGKGGDKGKFGEVSYIQLQDGNKVYANGGNSEVKPGTNVNPSITLKITKK